MLIALAFALLATSPPPTATSPSASTTRWLVILGGGAARADAERAIEALARAAPPMRAASGFPKVLRSDGVAGLKPGFEIAVLGACDDEATAKAMRDVAMLTPSLDGVYLRAVTGVDASCPTFVGDADAPNHAKDAKDAQRVGARAEASALEYVVGWSSLDEAFGRDQAACGTRGLEVSLAAHGKALAHASLSTCETLCSDHGEVGPDEVCGADTKEWTFKERVVVGERAWLVLIEEERHTRTRGSEPAAATRFHLYGYACGELRSVLSTTVSTGEGASFSARAASKDAKHVEVFVADGEERGKTQPRRFVWSDAQCAFKK